MFNKIKRFFLKRAANSIKENPDILKKYSVIEYLIYLIFALALAIFPLASAGAYFGFLETVRTSSNSITLFFMLTSTLIDLAFFGMFFDDVIIKKLYSDKSIQRFTRIKQKEVERKQKAQKLEYEKQQLDLENQNFRNILSKKLAELT